MSRKGHATPAAISAFTEDYVHGAVIAPHRHKAGQLLYSVTGVMTVAAAEGLWVVPPQRAVWIQPGRRHAVRASGRVAMRALFVHGGAARRLPRACTVIAVTPLLRALVLGLNERLGARRHVTTRHPMAALALAKLVLMDQAPLHLPMPTDRRARRVADALMADPTDARPLAAHGRTVGASGRTLARLFVAETGMSFGRWRQQRRLIAALESLPQGRPVTEAALDAGYATPSAFCAMFRRALGTSPSRFSRDEG
ncbi:MAG: AraC family transcriptional regulator [Alphaproteobacteria bacterium]|nr:AraC family transcriptional regulator [Alphaproteobacteria bacterium]